MFIEPKEIVAQLPLMGNEIVVDMGTGSGAYALELAKLVADGGGKVYAVDVQQDVLTRLAHTAKEGQITNIACVHADMEDVGGIHLNDGIADLAIISNTLFCTQKKKEVLQEAARLIHGNGHLLLIDWNGPYKGMGPEQAQVVTKEEGIRLAEQAGFSVHIELNSGEHHWALVFVRSNTSSVQKKFAI